MANLGQVLNQLRGERTRTQKELKRLDRAIAAFEKLVATNRRGKRRGPRARRKLSAAARRKISRAQKARRAKLRKVNAAKA